jgi:hypothetical protein
MSCAGYYASNAAIFREPGQMLRFGRAVNHQELSFESSAGFGQRKFEGGKSDDGITWIGLDYFF